MLYMTLVKECLRVGMLLTLLVLSFLSTDPTTLSAKLECNNSTRRRRT